MREDRTQEGVTRSLYETMATQVSPQFEGPPGTTETRQLETVDNDLMAAMSTLDPGLMSPTTPRPNPGTTYTFTIETIDNDFASTLSMAGPDAPRPRPNPGTGITATIETMDEHQSIALSLRDA